MDLLLLLLCKEEKVFVNTFCYFELKYFSEQIPKIKPPKIEAFDQCFNKIIFWGTARIGFIFFWNLHPKILVYLNWQKNFCMNEWSINLLFAGILPGTSNKFKKLEKLFMLSLKKEDCISDPRRICVTKIIWLCEM